MTRISTVSARIASEWKSFLPEKRARGQRYLIPEVQDRWNRKPHSFLGETDRRELEDPYEGGDSYLQNLYHVTTNLSGVMKSRRLKSRGEMSGREGLGGGPADTISATYSYDRALAIYQHFKLVSEIVQGQVLPSQILNFLGEHHGFYSWYDCREIVDMLTMFVPYEDVEADDVEERLDRKIRSPQDRYKFFQEVEKRMSLCGYGSPLSEPIGFVGDFTSMARINPDQIAILQLVARPGSEAEHVQNEMELRFHPQDVRVVRWMKP